MSALIGIALWALIPGFIARKKGRNFWGYYFLSFLISPLITMIITACLSKKELDSNEASAPTTQRISTCLNCGEKLLDGSQFCRKCGIEIIAPTENGEKCGMCDKLSSHLTYCKIKDDLGTRYRDICDECIKKYNAKPQMRN